MPYPTVQEAGESMTDEPTATNLVGSSASDWQSASPRLALRPRFFYDEQPGPSGSASLAISGGGNPACFGYWPRAVRVEPGGY